MAIKTCINNHTYDTDLYDKCPICNSPQVTQIVSSPLTESDIQKEKSKIITKKGVGVVGGTGSRQPERISTPQTENCVEEKKEPSLAQQNSAPKEDGNAVVGATANTLCAHTEIRKRKGIEVSFHTPDNQNGRCLVGLLVTTCWDAEGSVFKLYEGRNNIGRNSSSDICIAEDTQLSGRHCSIVYRSVDDKFFLRDEQSTNGTFVNGQIADSCELKNHDSVEIGNTKFVFVDLHELLNNNI